VGAGFKPASIATGSFSSFITSTTGQVVACGVNNYGQLGHLAEVSTPAAPQNWVDCKESWTWGSK